MDPTTVTAAAVNPVTFHLDCVDHLCRLENKLAGSEGDAGKGPTMTKLDTVMQLLMEITDFSEPRFSPDSFEKVAETVHGIYERTKSLQETVDGGSWSSVKRLFGQKSEENDSQLLSEYQGLKKDFKIFLVEYFVVCVKRFSSGSEEKRSFLESVDAFIQEIDRVWS